MFDELLHQGELQPVKIGNVNGTSCTGNDGNPLRAIGNHALYDGAYEWTDGVAVYGNQKVNNGALPIAAQKDGVPILSSSMKGYIDKTSRYHPYDIVGSDAITNSTRFCSDADAVSIDSEITDNLDKTTKSPVLHSIYGDSYLWVSGNITETDHAFHYMDADGKLYNPNGNVKTHETKWYDKHHDNSMKWHESNGGNTTNEKKFDYYDYEQTIFVSPFGENEYSTGGNVKIVFGKDVTSIDVKNFADTAGNDLKRNINKILSVIGKKKYDPSMMTPSFVLDGHVFWMTEKSASIINGKIFQDRTWWILVKASASAKLVGWATGVENKLVHKQENRAYPDGKGGGDGRWDGRIVLEKHQITCDSKLVSRYGIADIGITEYLLVSSSGKISRILSKYSTPDKRSGYEIFEADFSYKSYDYKDYAILFGTVIANKVEYASYHAYQTSTNPIVVFLDSVPADGNGIASVPICDGYRTVSNIDGTLHEVYDPDGKLITNAVSFSATDNVSACYLSTRIKADGTKAMRYLVGIHGKGIYLVENGTPTKLDDSLRNFRLRYMKPISRAKAKAKGES